MCNPCDSTALPCWDGNKKLVAKNVFLTLFPRVSGQYCEGRILGMSFFGVQKARGWEELLSVFCAKCVWFRLCHAVTLYCVVRRSLASSLQQYWMSWRREMSLGTAFHSEFYSSFPKWRITRQFWKQFMDCFKSELLCARATKEPEASSKFLWFWEASNKPDSETWL